MFALLKQRHKLPTPTEIKDAHYGFLFLLCGRSSDVLENASAETSIDARVRRA